MAVNLKTVCQLVGVVLLYWIPVQASRILVISNIPSVSHSLWYNKMAKMLADHGHQIIFLDIDLKRFDHKNITHIHMQGAYDDFGEFTAALASGAVSLESFINDFSVLGTIDFLTDPKVMGCRKLMFSEGFKHFIDNYKDFGFDLIVTDFGCDAFYGLVSYLGGLPFIVATPYSDPFYALQTAVAVHDNPAYVPTPFTNFLPGMSFKERLYNSFYKLYYHFTLHYNFLPDQQALAEEVFGRSVGRVTDILSNVALVMCANHYALFGSRPLPPTVIPIAGFHVDPVKPLPTDIKKFIDEAKNGVIYFSMGSNLKSIIMSKKNVQMFLDVFKDLPQRVVWKLEIDDKSNIPSNVFVSKWFPQNDILGHPNVRCFISHGGLLGVQEAIHHGVPILGMPIMFDQFPIIDRLEKEGVAVHLEYPKLTKTYFKEKLDKIITDKSIMSRMKERSKVFKDNPQTPQQRALFWVEYVLRNPTSLTYLKSSSVDLAWYQRTLIDVALVTLAAVVFAVIILIKTLTYLKKLLCFTNAKLKSD